MSPADEGVELASFDAPPRHAAPITPWVLEADRIELQRIGRRLRPCARHESACVAEPAIALNEPPSASEAPQPIAVPAMPPTEQHGNFSDARGDDVATGAEAAADCGLLVTLAGIATMAIQGEGFIAEEFWRWGFLGAVIGGTTFAAGVLRLATGAWRRSRGLQRELDALRVEVAQTRAIVEAYAPQPRPSLVGAKSGFMVGTERALVAASANAPRSISSRAA